MKASNFFVSSIVLLILAVGLTGPVNAELVDNENGTVTQIRNDSSMLMWLKDANTYGSTMTWDEANTWIGSINSSNHLGYNDWRLPDTLPVNGVSFDFNFTFDGSTDEGYNITSTNSEMAYMYYMELGGIGYYDTDGNYPQPGYGLTNTNPFENIQTTNYLSTEHPDDSLWYFNFSEGRQANYGTDGSLNVWAVRSMPVAPEPVSSSLFLIGAATLGVRRFYKKKRNS